MVIKYGGNAMTDPQLRRAVTGDLGALVKRGHKLMVVHGGGPFIAAALDEAGLRSRFVRGLRVTTPETLPVIETALTKLNKTLAQQIGNAVGLTGRDAGVVRARTFDAELGKVGQVTTVNAALLKTLLEADVTPVLACIAEDEAESGGVLNVNADDIAGAVAAALGYPVIFLSNVPGVLDDAGDPSSFLPELSAAEIQTRIADGRIAGGMIPKVEAALAAVKQGASYAVIASGEAPGMVQRVLRGEAGTKIHA